MNISLKEKLRMVIMTITMAIGTKKKMKQILELAY